MGSGSTKLRRLAVLAAIALIGASGPAPAQQAAPAVGVVPAIVRPIIQSNEFIGRVQAPERVNLVARVAAALEQRLFREGAEVKKGDLLYRLEQAPFQAEVQAKRALVAQFKAQLQNATATLGRAKSLLASPAGQQASVDTATANQQSLQAQIQGAEAQLQQALINLAYTEIRAPIDGKIGRATVSVGNFVTPTSGTLASIVSQDPMHIVFPVSARTAIELRRRSQDRGLTGLAIRIRLPDGRTYDQSGIVDFVDNTIGGSTDVITLRGSVPNPVLPTAKNDGVTRELVDGELVAVMLQDATPVQAIAIPRSAVLSDQGGDYVFVVEEDKAQKRNVKLGQSSPAVAAVMSGLREGENVIVEGIQRVRRPGQAVTPGPSSLPWPPPTNLSVDPSADAAAPPRG